MGSRGGIAPVFIAGVCGLAGCTFGGSVPDATGTTAVSTGTAGPDPTPTPTAGDTTLADAGGTTVGIDPATGTTHLEGDTTAHTGADTGPASSSDGEGSSSTGGAPVEICDGNDNDGDGLTDEGSPRNPACGDCVFIEAEGGETYFAYCTPPPEARPTWSEAEAACAAIGPAASLATIDAAPDQTALLEAMADGGDAWIGLSDLDDEGTWVWLDGTVSINPRGDVLPFDGWADGQPEVGDGGEDQDCGELDPASDKLGWSDAGCQQTQDYICEHPA